MRIISSLLITMAFTVLIFSGVPASAQNPPPDGSIPVALLNSTDPDLEPGFPVKTLRLSGTYYNGPIIHTLVGNIDENPDLEILTTGLSSGPLYAFNPDGSLQPGWPITMYTRVSYPSLGNLLDGTPGLEVFNAEHVPALSYLPRSPLFAMDGDGNLLPGWPKDSAHNIVTPAMLVDVDGDGIDEIFIHELEYVIQDGYMHYGLHGYRANGDPLPGWPVFVAERTLLAAADLDDNGDIEIITCDDGRGTDFNLVNYTLLAFNHDGTRFEGLNYDFKTSSWCKLHIADVDGDDQLEIILIGSLHEDRNRSILQVISAQGVLEAQWYLDTIIVDPIWNDRLSPIDVFAFADMDGDRTAEIIVQFDKGVSVYNGDGSVLPGFPVIFGSRGNQYIPHNAAPVVGDADGDGYPDILIVSPYGSIDELDEVRLYNRFGQLHSHFPKKINLGFGGTPAIADIDLDGRNEIIIRGNSTTYNPSGYEDTIWVYDLKGATYGPVEWGQFAGSERHQNRYVPPISIDGVDVYLAPFSSEALRRRQSEVSINIGYANLGAVPADATLSVELSSGLSYLSDNAPTPPTQSGNTLTWALGQLRYGPDKTITLRLSIPGGAHFLQYYGIDANISAVGDTNSQNNHATLMLAQSGLFFPLLQNP